MSANARMKGEWIFFITGVKQRFQKIDQREVSANARIKRNRIFFITEMERRFHNTNPKDKRGNTNQKNRDISVGWKMAVKDGPEPQSQRRPSPGIWQTGRKQTKKQAKACFPYFYDVMPIGFRTKPAYPHIPHPGLSH